ncbi:MAG: hypothetical protein ACI9A7_000993 [Cyclobacteriaceae bacterium]|jgi:hypothetical protein
MSKSDNEKPKVNKELEGFNLKVDSFGEIKSNISIDDINSFLNKNVNDKKLKDRDKSDRPKGKSDSEPSE